MKTLRNKHSLGGFTLLEILAAVGILAVVVALLFPVIGAIRQTSTKADSISKLRSITAAMNTYVNANGGRLPREDVKGKDNWEAARSSEADDAWYNALPRLLGQPGVGDYADRKSSFYQQDNVLYLRAAEYPGDYSGFREPIFAYAMNSRLQRRGDDGGKDEGKILQVVDPVRTVAFLESGIPGEPEPMPGTSSFDGSPKANPRDFVTRYGKTGLVSFLDGRVESIEVDELMTRGGKIHVPQVNYIWTIDPKEDPN